MYLIQKWLVTRSRYWGRQCAVACCVCVLEFVPKTAVSTAFRGSRSHIWQSDVRRRGNKRERQTLCFKGFNSPKAGFSDGAEGDAFPYIQTLRELPKEELLGKVVMVRFDSDILLPEKNDKGDSSFTSALLTIKYLHESGAKVLLVSSWSVKINSKLLAAESVAEFLSSVLQLKVVPVKSVSGYVQSKVEEIDKSNILLLENLSQFKEERANCSKFAEHLSAGVDIFVNDVFSQCHKILASNVGVTCFCCACVAGFHFEEDLYQLKKAFRTDKKPYVAIIGGGNFLDKAAALHFLASRCDGLIFAGNMAFQIMHALGLRVPAKFVEHGALEEALRLIQFAKSRNMPILFPKDFWCINDQLQNQFEIFPSDSILDGWSPFDLGPQSLDEITSLLSKCEKIMWTGPVIFGFANHESGGASELAQILDKLTQSNCFITVVGNVTSKAVMKESSSVSVYNVVKNAAVMWEFLKRRKLPGLMALDRAYPFEIDWHAAYTDPAQPLFVDIGSARTINRKRIVSVQNGKEEKGTELSRYFIATNATSSFRSIVSSYPGEIVLVSIQCPNPDFNKPEHRWRMVQKSLIEGIGDLLASDGKVFLQSDIEPVALRMKEQFIEYGKGKLAVVQDHKDTAVGQEEWLKENPFGVQSDWEQHVLQLLLILGDEKVSEGALNHGQAP
ncbi:hypothetical protein RJ639_047331 [Escallonia herrerae]|uniref:Phosphoglycerate kinase n=1 Tax=Escallonia herrerae TaxID=1293975 RepID=A0AA89B0T6_9ASTE|nr:hypothetical protein RJ639_047331 [Escallonia herrerae]